MWHGWSERGDICDDCYADFRAWYNDQPGELFDSVDTGEWIKGKWKELEMDANEKVAEELLSKAMGHKVDLEPHLEEAKDIVEIAERGFVTRITVDQHEALVAQRVSALEGKNKTLQEALDRANILDKQLHDQIEELSVPYDGEEATRGDLIAALDAAESATKDLECQNKRLRHRIEELQGSILTFENQEARA